MRKTSRGASRTQRRRRSKSPILHPPKFTYCSTAAGCALSNPSGGLKHQRLAEPSEPCPPTDAVPAQNELSSSGAVGHLSPLIFGSCGGYETCAAVPEIAAATALSRPDGDGSQTGKGGDPERSAGGGAEFAERAPAATQGAAEAADFRALSERHGSVSADGPCSCAWKKGCPPHGEDETTGRVSEPECRCGPLRQGWQGVEVYSFTGLRNVISECERSLPGREDAHRTRGSAPNAAAAASSSSSPLSSGSPRSCSEQARAFVDDITIEDLSGYMEYYLYIPKKMSHMAEMMYT
ncbi:oxidative stress-responsive serine-rich protein 1 isoform 2-T2 [Spinachia spinachia]